MSLAELAKEYPANGNRNVLVTEVTRMGGGRVCVAGIDIHDGRMVRPLQPTGANWEEDKWVAKGYMKVGNLLALEPAPKGNSDLPHATEDFRVARVGVLKDVPAAQLHAACAETADESIEAIFDGALKEGKYVDEKPHNCHRRLVAE